MSRKASEEKQLVQCLNAVTIGAQTSTEVAAVTGLSIKHCSAWLHELKSMNAIERTGRFVRFGTNRRKSIVWRIAR